MKDFSISSVAEIVLAGVIIVALYSLFGGWLAKHGAAIHGSNANGEPTKV